MKATILAGAAALALSACASITDRTGLSAADQQCVATHAMEAVDIASDMWGQMTNAQRAEYLTIASGDIATACGVDASAITPYLVAAQQAAALVD